MESVSRELPAEFPIQRWEFNAILLKLVILGGAGMGGLVGVAHRLLLRVDDWVLFPAGFLLLGLAYIPLESVLARTLHQRKISIVRSVLACLAGTILFALIARFLR